jgi:hypothetical protein
MILNDKLLLEIDDVERELIVYKFLYYKSRNEQEEKVFKYLEEYLKGNITKEDKNYEILYDYMKNSFKIYRLRELLTKEEFEKCINEIRRIKKYSLEDIRSYLDNNKDYFKNMTLCDAYVFYEIAIYYESKAYSNSTHCIVYK